MEQRTAPRGMHYIVTACAIGLVAVGLLSLRAPTPERLTRYTSTAYGFSASYPAGFVVDDHYVYEGQGLGTDIRGVSFGVPAHYTRGTNLSPDSRVAVEVYTGAYEQCNAGLFLAAVKDNPQAMDGQVKEAAAGNLYEESVFVIEDSVPCTAIRYFIHSTTIENYPDGSVRAFDRHAVQSLFDTIRTSVTLAR